jgi:protein EFR3
LGAYNNVAVGLSTDCDPRNVQVTLQILAAIIEKAPRDLSLYSKSILTILDSVLRSGDVNMVEDSIPTFEAYCKHVSSASLTADQQRAQQYLSIVQHYAGFAAKKKPADKKVPDSIPLSLRWRTLGLRAIRAVVGSEALATDSNRQLNLVMPVILENLSLEEDNVLATLQQRAKTSERMDDETARRRRMSIATVTTVDTIEGDPAAAVETTAGADKVAEEEVRALALRCLKQIFSVGIGSTRGQTRLATALTLKFIASRNPPKVTHETSRTGNWATSLFEAIARWTPVQDRFIIVVTAMETLVRSPMAEGVLEKQLVLTTMVDWLLSSPINLIGLSVMDVLLGFVQHMLVLLQLGGPNARFAMQNRQDTLGFYKEAKEAFDPSSVLTENAMARTPSKELIASPARQELLESLQKCIAALSNHIYYTDQISDMLTAILARLKPSPQSEVPTTAAAINDPVAATKAIAESASIHEDANSSTFFSFATARVTANRVIKDILIRANSRRNAAGAPIEARARVGVQVWEGTQWLLKDEDRDVRVAYVDALLTWLKLETNKSDLLLPKDGNHKKSQTKKSLGENGMARRAVSTSSRKETAPTRSNFLALLHLAMYDSILDEPENETNILMLYLLLTKLVERLGVNAVRSGMPMILRLQETALNGEVVSAVGRVNVASIVHGYLWTITDKFDFETSPSGHEINAEISRRKRFGIWFDQVKFPASPIDQIKKTTGEKSPEYKEEAVETIKPFLTVGGLVEEIASAYDEALLTPPNSPPSSPGRVFSVPTLGFGYGYGAAPLPKASREDQLPQKVKDEMTAGWSRESCIAAVEKESTLSIAGSRTGASSIPRQHLVVGESGRPLGSVNGKESPGLVNGNTTPTYGLVVGLGSLTQMRRPSANGSPARVPTTSSRDSTVRVTDLKRALSGYAVAGRRPSPTRRPQTGSRRSTGSSGTSSMLSWDDADDRNPSFLDVTEEQAVTRPKTSESTKSKAPTNNGTYHDQTTLDHVTADPKTDDSVPPVPKIPSTLNLPGTWPKDASREPSPVRPTEVPLEKALPAPQESPQSRKIASNTYSPSSLRDKQSLRKSSRPTSRKGVTPLSSSPAEKFDLGTLLAAIPTTAATSEPEKENRTSRLIRPPY